MFSRLSLPLLGLLSLAAAYSKPVPCIGYCWAHDPSTIQASDKSWWRFSTNGGIVVARAETLASEWVKLGDALPKKSIINPAIQDLWAPDVHLIGSTYYMFYAVSTFQSQNSVIGVATSFTLKPGEWKDLGSTGIESKPHQNNYNAIDPSLLIDGNTYQLFFGSFYADIFQVHMTSPPTKAVGAPQNVAFDTHTTSRPYEGPAIFKRGPYYYLLISDGVCCHYDTQPVPPGAEYKIIMGRTDDLTLDFKDKNGVSLKQGGGSVLLSSYSGVYGPGGQSVYFDGASYLLSYHYATSDSTADADYRFGLNILKWVDDWPQV